MYAVVMAGGSGTRFWPRSRTERPKQFQSIGTNEPLIVETIERLKPLITPEYVRIVATGSYAKQINDLLPQLPSNALIVEPTPRNTAPCIGLAALHISQIDPTAVMAILPADHHIGNASKLRELMMIAQASAVAGHIVTLGIVPNRPETGYGYIEVAHSNSTESESENQPRSVVRFVEKPDSSTAADYLESGRYLWNSGMFFFRCDTILNAIQVHMPKLYRALKTIEEHIGDVLYDEVLEREFSGLNGISIDYGIMEPITALQRQDTVKVIPADMGWNDVGHWSSLRDFAQKDSHGNVVDGEAVVLDCEDNVIQSDTGLIAAVGVNDLVIVKDGDIVMVCPRDRAQDVKKIVETLKNQGRRDLV